MCSWQFVTRYVGSLRLRSASSWSLTLYCIRWTQFLSEALLISQPQRIHNTPSEQSPDNARSTLRHKKDPDRGGGVKPTTKQRPQGRTTRRLRSLRDSRTAGNPQKKKHTIPSPPSVASFVSSSPTDQPINPDGRVVQRRNAKESLDIEARSQGRSGTPHLTHHEN